MKKLTISVASAIFVLSALVLFILVEAADRPNKNKNGFLRTLFTNPFHLLNQASTPINITHIAGASDRNIYFTSNDPRVLVTTDYSLKHLDTLSLPIPLTKMELVGATTFANYPKMTMLICNSSKAISYTVKDSLFYATKLSPPLFTRAVPLDSTKVALRAFDSSRQHQLFEIVNNKTGKILEKGDIIRNQRDAGFSTDGLLDYDESTHSLIYVQFYQNRFFCMDTGLNLKYIGHTIDTINTNPVLTRSFATKNAPGSLLPTAPLTILNNQICTYNGSLFVLANLQADNEKNSVFHANSVIDVYRLIDGRYRGSFYIPHLDREKVQSFKIVNNTLIVVYKTHLATYSFTPEFPV
jgi:hypothetical protein